MDAAGAAATGRYTYLVPDALADLEPGEAVLVEFGRRQALGIVLAEAGDRADGSGWRGRSVDRPAQADRRPGPGRRPAAAAL